MTDNATDEPQGDTDSEKQEDQAVDWQAEAARLKAESRKWESRAKENSTAAQRLTDLENASKSELQIALDRAEAAEKAIAAAQAESLRLTIAARHGITGDALDLLNGSTEEELEAKAVKLAALITDSGKADPFPKADPSQGSQGGGGKTSTGDMFAALVSKKL